jgi:hypothetical protein
MKPRIVDLRVDEMEWMPLGPPGLYSRLLSRDLETGARTALQRIVPEDGYTPPQKAHYHHTYEEIIGIAGCFSFDSRRWVKPGTYIFHPPRTVHGFASAVRSESLFLSRVGRDLDFNFVENPEHDDLYVVEGPPPPRGPQALEDFESRNADAAGRLLGGGVMSRILSIDPDSGEGSALVRLPAGWSSSETMADHDLELFVMEGAIRVDGSPEQAGLAYFSYPAGSAINRLAADSETLVYVNFAGPVGL